MLELPYALLLRAQSGSTNFENFFPGFDWVDVDRLFRNVLEAVGPEYRVTEDFHCRVFEGEKGDPDGFWQSVVGVVELNKLFAVIRYLGNNSSLLNIPPHGGGVNVAIGCVDVGGAWHALVVKHRFGTIGHWICLQGLPVLRAGLRGENTKVVVVT